MTLTCQQVATVLHSTVLHSVTLTSVKWILLQAVLLYMIFVQQTQWQCVGGQSLLTKLVVISWGLPAITIVAVLCVHHGLYFGGELYCRSPSEDVYYVFAAVVMGTSLAFYVCVLTSIYLGANTELHPPHVNSQLQNHNVKLASIVSCTSFVVSWAFGFLAISTSSVPFQYLFVFTTMLQGFMIYSTILSDKTGSRWNLKIPSGFGWCDQKGDSKAGICAYDDILEVHRIPQIEH